MIRRLNLSTALLAIAFVMVGCGGGDAGSGDSHSSGNHGGDGSAMDFGAPADSEGTHRTIEVEALDSLEFDPNSVEVESGEVVTFVITNTGSIDHEFVLGDETFQAEHADAMAEGDMDHGGGMAVEIEPGETKRITWRFSSAGTILYGCHEPGHYEGGMVGSIEVA